MKQIKVSEATDPTLDWLVAKCEGIDLFETEGWLYNTDEGTRRVYRPTTDWSQAGPIIEREGINLSVNYQDDAMSNDMVQVGWKGNLWDNSVPGTAGFLRWACGPTPLIAAMRCFAASKLGETAEVPEELL